MTAFQDADFAVALLDADRSRLEGEHGVGAQMAMSIVARMADVLGATALLDITAAHIDSALFLGDATLEYAEHLAQGGASVVVPTTLNVSGVEEQGWRRWAVSADWAAKAQRQMRAYEQMGCKPTYTCAPYQTEERPAFGQQIAWGESSAIVFANSVLGARTERYPDLFDICAAITGRVPAVGLHLEENRRGQVLIQIGRLPDRLRRNDALYPVLGHLIGREVADRVPVIDGLEVDPTEDQLKALGAAMASSGAVALFHLVGVTPEAPTANQAFQGYAPERTVEIDLGAIRAARDDLSSASDGALDMVVLGSPHFSLEEFQRLARLVQGRQRDPKVRFLVTTSRAVAMIAKRAGSIDAVLSFGGEIMVDTCILTSPVLGDDVRTLMTNSAKFAYYTPGLLDRGMVFGALEDCVNSAERGRIERDDSLWHP